MNDDAFLRAIWERPDDAGPESVYADWLEEQGDPRAEYLRARLALRMADGPRRQAEAAGRFRELLTSVPHDWAVLLELAAVSVHVETWQEQPGGDGGPVAEFAGVAPAGLALTFGQGRLIADTITDDEWPVGLHVFGTMGETEVYRVTLDVRQGCRVDERILFDLRRLYRDALNYSESYEGILDRAEFEAAGRAG